MLLTIYQGRNVHNRTSQFFTTDKEWARQFTQSGIDNEVRIAKIDPKVVYMDEPLPQATNVNELETTIKKAINGGFSAVWVDEGQRQPPSIFVIDMKVLRIMRQSIIRESLEKTVLEKATEDFRQSLIHQYPQIEDLFFSIQWSQDILYLSSIRIKPKFRKQGIGRKIIEAIKDFADKHKLVITLTPEAERRYKKKLHKFYTSAGFVKNKGRKKDYRLSSFFGPTMYRKPGMNEGAILIHRLDKNAISKYMNDMDVFCKDLFHYYKEIDCEKLESILQTKSDSLKSNVFPFKIKYSFHGRGQGYYINNPPTINIVFSAFTDFQENWLKNSNTTWKRSWKCSKLDFKKLSVTFLHEFVHYIQDVYRKEKSGDYRLTTNWSEPDKYYKRGWEQQAQAIGYLEKLRKEWNIKKPEELLNQLRTVGVLHNRDLNRLKQSDYKSWKSIMKQAVMTAIADIRNRVNRVND